MMRPNDESLALPGGGPMLLICSVVISGLCLILLARLFSRARALDRSNRELERANRELDLANRELDLANRDKARFVASLSHELRNPLGSVIGFTELLEDGHAGELNPRQREHLGIIRGSAAHILRLTDELLDMAAIEAGHVRVAPEPVDPAQLARACVSSLAPLAASRGVEVEVAAGEARPVELDPGRLRQVVLNYLSNAIKFSPTGAKVSLRVGQTGEGRLRIEVADAGVGIAPADQARIFEEFVQVPGRAQLGTGLGLAITKMIVGAQGGEVGVRSRLGQGSTFFAELPARTVALPCSRPAVPISVPVGPPAPRPGRGPAPRPTIQISRSPALAERR